MKGLQAQQQCKLQQQGHRHLGLRLHLILICFMLLSRCKDSSSGVNGSPKLLLLLLHHLCMPALQQLLLP
jgi:hypothetical protein